MKIYYPMYYKQFHCIAADCPDSCCKEWIVDVDAQSAACYRALPGDLGARLRDVLADTEDGAVMTIENGRCPMWRQDSLCRIQAELGHDALCKTCREYPRLQHDFGDFLELGLELSCPEAARLILTSPWEMVSEEVDGHTPAEYDPDIMELLLSSRRDAIVLLADTRFSPAQRLAILLLYAHDIQGQIDGGDPAPLDPEILLAEAKDYVQKADIDGIFALFRQLEILSPAWAARLRQPLPLRWFKETIPLAVYWVQRYWLQAVSDLDLICRVKFLVVGCILINALGGDPMQTAQRFSKEIENDLDNLDAILNAAYTNPALTDANLLGILLDKNTKIP